MCRLSQVEAHRPHSALRPLGREPAKLCFSAARPAESRAAGGERPAEGGRRGRGQRGGWTRQKGHAPSHVLSEPPSNGPSPGSGSCSP